MTRLRLDGLADAVPRSRRFAAEALRGVGSGDLAWEAEVIVGELVTNALLHGVPPAELSIDTRPDGARITVEDASRVAPVRPRPGDDTMTGRGLALVDALATRWGVDRTAGGKVVWADVGAVSDQPDAPAPSADQAARAGTAVAEGDERRYRVSLGDVPTDLLLAAKAHVDDLVREFTLTATGAASGTSTRPSPHLARLIHSVTTDFADARQSIKRQALAAAAAGQERTRLELFLPVSAAAAAEAYLAGVDEADSFARAARLLTLETPPQHRAFRHWYILSLVRQLRAYERGERPPPAETFERYLLETLDEITSAQRVAERAARLQSITATLATATTVDRVAAIVTSEAVEALGASGGTLLVPLDETHLAVHGSVGYSDELVAQLRAELRDAPLPAAEVMRTGVPVWLENQQVRDEHYPDLVGLEPGTVAMCALPLTVGGKIVGALRFSFEHSRLFDADERRFAVALAAQTAQSLERARLFAVERQARERITFLSDAGETLAATLDGRETVNNLAGLLVPRFADWAVVYLLDDDGGGELAAIRHREPDVTAELAARSLGGRLEVTEPDGIAEVLRTGITVRYADVPETLRRRSELIVNDAELAAQLAPLRVMGVALRAQGRVTGGVGLVRTGGDPFTDDDQSLVEDLAARAAVAVGNAQRYERERKTALALQRNLLPQRLPNVPGLSFAWRYMPAGEGTAIGGDWYDVLPFADGTVALLIGDVMGRGVQAAAIMGQLRATARAFATARLPPSAALAELDAAVNRLEQGSITTAAFGLLNPMEGRLTVASAGHLPPLVVPAGGEPFYLPVDPGPPLGAATPEYAEAGQDLGRGSTLLLFTDGLVEDRHRPIDTGLELLRRAAAGTTSAEELCDRVVPTLAGPDGYTDDTAMLAVTLTNP